MKRGAVAILAAMAALAMASSAAAQQARGPIMTTRDAGIFGAGIAASLLLMGADVSIAEGARSASLQDNGAVKAAGLVGDPGSIVAGAALWASGRFGHNRTRELVGLRSLEAITASSAVTLAIKSIAGRARPDQSPMNARDFEPGRGFGDRSEFQSYPSGHATAAFAFAAAVDAELDRIAPDHPAWIVPLLYTAATATAASRVYRDRHWTSDVVLGATIGFVGGRAVVRWHDDDRRP